MKKNKKIILEIIIILLIIIIGIVVAYKLIENDVTNREKFKINVENISSTPVNTVNNEKNKENIEWNEITEDGVNEKLLVQNVNIKDLEKIATLLQSLSEEIAQKEKEDINFYLSAGWYKYTLDSQQFNEVISMGNEVKYARLKCLIDIFAEPEKYINIDTGNTYADEILGFSNNKESEDVIKR